MKVVSEFKFDKEVLALEPYAGTTVYSAVRHACIAALAEERDVVLKFNGHQVAIRPGEIIGDLLKQYPMGSDQGK